ncbi:transcriptional regulator, CopG family [Pyrobaculum calidifontis JCM 11548]|uniref:Transcriptional regulator, CopG family n=1 Tax=Pyrobaculum calidifontis (strain DSM 21063 / JCM 11548 / VA1) TaxID=410359 RepID=A3MTJ6_PYRCJ|nr:transcriptional regulator, CopG family [Pyrobaculum calidifontis JCM 11548]
MCHVGEKREKMVLISFHVPQSYVEMLDELVKSGVFPNRSEAVRAALRELLNRYMSNGR